MLNVPAEENVWQGFCEFEVLSAEAASPKFQVQPVIVPGVIEDRSLKQVDTPRQTGVDVKFATGDGLTTAIRGKESLHPKLFVTTKEVVYVPAALYVCEGFCCVDVFPSPKFQLHPEIVLFPVERSVNAVGLFKQTMISLKFATGSGFTVTGIEIVSPQFADPASTIKVTV
jgi:hypothetical protein